MKKNLQNNLNFTSSKVSILCIVLLATSSYPLMSMVEGPKVEQRNAKSTGPEENKIPKSSLAERASNIGQSASNAVSAAVETAKTTLGFNKAPQAAEAGKNSTAAQKSGLQLASDAFVNTGKSVASAAQKVGSTLYHAPGYAVEALGGNRQFITGEKGSLSFAAKTAYNTFTGKSNGASATDSENLSKNTDAQKLVESMDRKINNLRVKHELVTIARLDKQDEKSRLNFKLAKLEQAKQGKQAKQEELRYDITKQAELQIVIAEQAELQNQINDLQGPLQKLRNEIEESFNGLEPELYQQMQDLKDSRKDLMSIIMKDEDED